LVEAGLLADLGFRYEKGEYRFEADSLFSNSCRFFVALRAHAGLGKSRSKIMEESMLARVRVEDTE
jgi:hypothetical protein